MPHMSSMPGISREGHDIIEGSIDLFFTVLVTYPVACLTMHDLRPCLSRGSEQTYCLIGIQHITVVVGVMLQCLVSMVLSGMITAQ